MKNLSKKWIIGIAIVALGLLAVGVPVLASSGNNTPATGSTTVTNNYGPVCLDSITLGRLATALGLTPADLTSQLQSGKTLAAIAAQKNVSNSVLVDAITAPYAAQVALQVQYGYLTQAQAQTILDAARQVAGNLLTQNLTTAGGIGCWTGFCGNYLNGNAAPVTGQGMMGSGMMGGWGGYTSVPSPITGTTTTVTPGVPATTTQPVTGWGMMGGWGCR